MTYEELLEATQVGAAIRRRRRLQPVGGIGDKIFPPTYPGDNGPRHVFEVRRVQQTNGEMANVPCVLIDSVQSQANRLEEALEAAALRGEIELPRIVVDFAGAGFNSIGAISDLVAPHRIFDAILRDSDLNGTAFRKSEVGEALRLATPADASAILNVSPASLLFGAWNSTGEGGGLGAKFARAIVSEIVGVGVAMDQSWKVVRRGAEEYLVTATHSNAGRRTGSRIDPLGSSSSVPIYHKADDPNDWTIDPAEAQGGPANPKPFDRKRGSGKPGTAAKVNHGNIPPSVDQLGVTCDYAEQTSVITLAGLRRLSFSGRSDAAKDEAGRAYLAALGLLALTEGDRNGYALRSRCDLVCDGAAPIELVGFDGSAQAITLSPDNARHLYQEALRAAREAGFTLSAAPLQLTPSDKLAQLVRKSQDKAMDDEADASED